VLVVQKNNVMVDETEKYAEGKCEDMFMFDKLCHVHFYLFQDVMDV
jgi:hypothetical protein